MRVLAWLALVIPAVTLAAPRPQPNLELLIPVLLLSALPLVLPAKLANLKVAIAIGLTVLLIVMGSQLPGTIVVLGFVLAEIAVQRSTRDLVWSAAISILIVGATSVFMGDADNLRPLWLVHTIGIAMFLALGIAIRERRALVAETKRSLEVAENAHQVQLAEAITQERLNISRDLHNRLGHQLTVISLNAEVAKQIKTNTEEMRTTLDVIGESARQSLDEISTYLESLREKPEMAQQTDLLTVKFERFRKLGLTVRASVLTLPQSDKWELIEFFDTALEELLINALKYGNGIAEYQQSYQSDTLIISLTNESSSSKDVPSSGGFGLKDIGENAAQLGAVFSHETQSDGLFKASLNIRGWG